MHCIMQELIADSDHEHMITMSQVCYAHIKHAAISDKVSPIEFGRKNLPDALAS